MSNEENKTAEALVNVAETLHNTKVETWKDKFMRLAMALLYEKSDDGKWTLSIGRVSWWFAFAPALHVWAFKGVDITEHHLTILLVLAGYNLGKHGLNAIKARNGSE